MKNTAIKLVAQIFTFLLVVLFIPACSCKLKCENGVKIKDRGRCECDCKTGWQGTICDEEIQPKAIIIARITLLRAPEKKPNGDTWDLAAGQQNPDLMINLFRERTATSMNDWFLVSEKIGGVKLNQLSPQTFVCTNNCRITLVDRRHRISLYDEDTSPALDELIGAVNFIPYSRGEKFPRLKRLADTARGVEFELELNYEF